MPLGASPTSARYARRPAPRASECPTHRVPFAGYAAGVEPVGLAEQARHAHQYRQVNDGIHRGGDDVFLCECLRADCHALVEVSAAEYAAVRAHPARFLLLAGHELEGLDTVVERHGQYLVVDRAGAEFVEIRARAL
jgi:hypothetical protein